MIVPDDPFDLVIPAKPDFRLNLNWQAEFGKYCWFYVIGVRTLFARAGIFDKSDGSDSAPNVAVPELWRRTYGGIAWELPLATNQVRKAINCEPMCFDKACLSILAIIHAVDTHGHSEFLEAEGNSPVARWLRIKPALFVIDGNPQLTRFHGHTDRILAAGQQKKPEVLKELERGDGGTHLTLQGMADYLLKNSLHPHNNIVVKDHRRGGRKASTVARNETIQEVRNPETFDIIN